MYNMCKISPPRQEAAALAGIVPLLVKLATPAPPEPSSSPQAPALQPGTSAYSFHHACVPSYAHTCCASCQQQATQPFHLSIP